MIISIDQYSLWTNRPEKLITSFAEKTCIVGLLTLNSSCYSARADDMHNWSTRFCELLSLSGICSFWLLMCYLHKMHSMYMHTYTDTRAHTHTHTHTHTHKPTHTNTYTICTHANKHTNIHTHIHTHTYRYLTNHTTHIHTHKVEMLRYLSQLLITK